MSKPVQPLHLIGKARAAALTTEAQNLAAADQTATAVLTSLAAFNAARCRPPLSRRHLHEIVELASRLRAMNARNRRFWDRRSKHFELLASKLPIDLRNAVQIQHDLEPAIQFLSRRIKGDDEESIAAMEALRPLLRLADIRSNLQKVRLVRRTKGRSQVSGAASARRQRGADVKKKVEVAARRVLKSNPLMTRDDVASKIAPSVGLSPERTAKYLTELRLFADRGNGRR